MERITSRKNPIIARFRRLAGDKAARRSEGLCLGQGQKLLDEALQNAAVVDTVLYAGAAPDLPPAVRQYRVAEELLAYISPMKSTPELVFTCRLPSAAAPLHGRVLLAEELQDPGNVGTLIRTAAAFGFDALLLAGDCADPWSPKAIRASMGAVFRLGIAEGPVPEALQRLQAAELPIYAAALARETEQAGSFCFPSTFALAIGNEGHGLSQAVLEAAYRVVRIPMAAGAESLNAAAAAAVLMWESFRRRADV